MPTPSSKKPAPRPTPGPRGNHSATSTPPVRQLANPVFAQPEPTPDPTTFRVQHPSDGPAYKSIDALNKAHKIKPLPFPAARGGAEPQLTLHDVLGGNAGAI